MSAVISPPCRHAPPQPRACAYCLIASRDARYAQLWGGPPAPERPRGPCEHLGEPTGETVACGTCRGGVKLKLFACAVHGRCTLGKTAAPNVATCEGCGDYRPGWPIRYDQGNLWSHVPGHRFNSSLLPHEGGYLFATRTGWAGSEIYLGRMDAQFRPQGRPWKLRLYRAECAYGREDPYLFTFRGRVHVGYVGVVGPARSLHTNVLYARLHPRTLQVEENFAPRYAARRAWEKSHMPFEHSGNLFMVYSISPHQILYVKGEQATLAYECPGPSPWTPGTEMRGGAAPVLHNGEWYHFFHSRYDRPRRTYFMGCYTFSPEPPFSPLRVVPEPLIVADRKTNTGPDRNYCDVFFPRGAVISGDHWVISAGIHDRWTELRRIRQGEIERRLVPVRGRVP
jgi:predicted GH43/DUF377 family glycosyl hydrolase